MGWVEQDTIGNGDCGLGAFAGQLHYQLNRIAKKSVANRNEEEKNFLQSFHQADLLIEAIAGALNVDNDADAVIAEMLAEQNSRIIQSKLASALRQLSIKLIRNNKEQLKQIQRNLIETFNNPIGDDIFLRHPHIKAKFDTYVGDEKELKNWWNTQGQEQFLQNMANPDLHHWTGDIELVALGEHLGVNINVKNKNTGELAALNLNNGEFPVRGMNNQDVEELKLRSVLHGNNPDNLPMTKISKEVLSKRLDFVSNDANEQQEIVTHLMRNSGNLKGQRAPNWQPETCKELTMRGILSHKQNDLVFTSDFQNMPLDGSKSLGDALARIDNIPNKDAIVTTWEQNKIETIDFNFSNPYSTHWTYLTWQDPQPKEKVKNLNRTLFFNQQKSENDWDKISQLFLKAAQGKEDLVYSINHTYIRKNGDESKVVLQAKDIVTVDKANGFISYDIGNKTILVDVATQVFLDSQFSKFGVKQEIEAHNSSPQP